MKNGIRLKRVLKAMVVISILFFAACNPSVYRKPSQDFYNASVSLREAYFLELRLSNKAFIEQGDLDDQLVIWGSKIQMDKDTVKSISAKMANRRGGDIHDDLTPLRENAFSALEGYASVLVSLASEDQTEGIVTELNGMVKDINQVLDVVKKTKIAAGQIDKVASFTGPLAQYVGVLNEVIRLVSNVVRYQAIRQTIVKSDDSIRQLLLVLRQEAILANNNTQKQLGLTRGRLEGFMSNPGFAQVHNTHKAAIGKRIAELQSIENQAKKAELVTAFDAAVQAQGVLLKSTLKGGPSDWAGQIRSFREQVDNIRKAIEVTTIEM